MNEKFTLTGGARIGRANATYPFADLYVDKNILTINASLIGNVAFAPKDIISIDPFSSVPILGRGIKINHRVENYNPKIIFWTCQDPAFVINEIKKTGFLDNNTGYYTTESTDITHRQNQGGFPIKKPVAILFIIVWNALLLSDLIPFFTGNTTNRTPFGNGINLALGLVVACSLLIVFSEKFRKLVLKDGREFSDIKKGIYFILLISGIMFITFINIGPLKRDIPGLSAETNTADSLVIGNYQISVYRSYFFLSANSQTKSEKFVSKDDFVEVHKISGDFAYAAYTPAGANQIKGWLLLKDLKQIIFTPPKIVK